MNEGIVSTLRRKVRLRTRLEKAFSAESRLGARLHVDTAGRVPVTADEILRVLKDKKYVSPKTENQVVDAFHRLYYDSKSFGQTWGATYWLGTLVQKCPLDLWIYQEIIFELRPDLIIETGTAYGGSAGFLAATCDMLGKGQVVSVDIDPGERRPSHSRLTYLLGSSTSPSIVQQLKTLAEGKAVVMVILDSDHSKDHVLQELGIYSELVSPGSYLIVEDTNVNGHPVYPGHGPGPMEAVQEFLKADRRYSVDRSREKFLLTFNPGGFLRREA